MDVEPADETDHADSIPVDEILRGRRTLASPRLLTERVTDVQRAPSRHAEPVNRRLTEAEIIGDDQKLLDVTVLVLARIGFSEGGWNRRDYQAIYQVIRGNRGRQETLLNAMRNHSRIASEVWAPRRARERWLVGLNLELTEPETEWGDVTAEGAWERIWKQRWATALEWASDLVHGRDRTKPCPVPVTAWGGRCDVPSGACDDSLARRRGLVPVECGDTQNRYWAWPRHLDGVQQLVHARR